MKQAEHNQYAGNKLQDYAKPWCQHTELQSTE
jgi:hypothetical protein